METAIDYDREILASEHARVKELTAEELDPETDEIRIKVIYTIIWE